MCRGESTDSRFPSEYVRMLVRTKDGGGMNSRLYQRNRAKDVSDLAYGL